MHELHPPFGSSLMVNSSQSHNTLTKEMDTLSGSMTLMVASASIWRVHQLKVFLREKAIPQ